MSSLPKFRSEYISIAGKLYDQKNTKSQRLLGINNDNKLTINEQVSNLCDKASRKINTLARVFL